MEYEHISLDELRKRMTNKEDMYGVIVFKNESFDKEYPLESRSYVVNSDMGGYFKPYKIANSLYGTSIDKSDIGVRLDMYLPFWKVDYCYVMNGGKLENGKLFTDY